MKPYQIRTIESCIWPLTGTFGFDPKDNFVVLGAKQEGADAFNEILTIGELDAIIREVSDPDKSAD